MTKRTDKFVKQLRKELTTLAEEERNRLFTLSDTSNKELKTKYKNQLEFISTIKIDIDELINAMVKDWHIE